MKWPLRLHLHVALPTNLSRGDWISDGALDAQISGAMAGLATWLEAHTDLWHPAWSPSELIEREPEADEDRAGHAVECLRKEVRARKLVRSLGGGFVTGAAARGLEIVDREDVRAAWRRLAAHPQFHELAPRLAFASVALGVNPTQAAANDCLHVLAEIAGESAIDHPEHVQDAMAAALSIEPPSAKAIERVLAEVQLPRAEGRTIALSELAKARRSAHLASGWHPFFAELLKWNDRRAVGGTVFGTALGGALDFAEPEFYVDWCELPDFLATAEAWGRNGDEFWSDHRAECPQRHAARVIAALHLPDEARGWQPITGFWLHDTHVPSCLDDVLSARADASRIANKLRRWELLTAYDNAVEKRLADALPATLTTRFARQLDADPLAMLEEGGHASARDALPLPWQKVIADAERIAVTSFRASHPIPTAWKRLISTRLSEPFRSLLLKCDEFQLAPAWVTPLAWQAIARLKPNGHQTLPAVVFPDSLQNPARRNELSELLLAQAHRWAGSELTEPETAALNDLCRDCNGNTQITLARGHPDFLRNILAVPGGTSPAHCGGGKWHWHGRRHLPVSLTRAAHLVRACLTLDDAKPLIEKRGDSVPVVVVDVVPELRANPQFAAALTALGGSANLRYCAEFKLVWRRGDEPLCELRDLDFARDGDLLLVSRVVHPPDVTGYADALAKYLGFRNDPAVRQARTAGQSPVAIYEQHREKILAVFRRELVERVGYRVEHVLRELLQNAESAYASQAGEKPAARPFRITISAASSENDRKVAVEHRGRAFNEVLNDGHDRDDVQQIVSLCNSGHRGAEEIGRFNRGFKSVFHVTQTVRIRSGRYDFFVRDLLILQNAESQEGEPRPGTSFEWECTAALAEELLQWNVRRPQAARVGVFDSRALIFLREVTTVAIHYRDQQWSWGMRRIEESEGWLRVEIIAPDGATQRFRVCACVSRQRWQGEQRRLAVGFEVDAHERPVLPDAAPLYLWFPTEMRGPCGLWFNGDFDVAEDCLAVRDSSNNAALIKEALGLAVEEARRQIAANPETAMWLAWAKVLAPQNGRDWVRTRMPEDEARLRAGFDDAAAMLAAAIPHGARLRRSDELRQPTQFLRRLAEKFAGEWEIETDDWIDAEIGVELDRFTERSERFSLESHIGEHRDRHDLLRKIRDAASSQIFRSQWVRTAPEQQEHDRAINAIFRFLPTPTEPEPLSPVSRSLAELLAWWQDERDLDPYTLDGDWWPLLFDGAHATNRVTALREVLSRPADADGRLAWYQVLAVPCLLSIPRRVEQTRSFWQRELATRDFWRRTAEEGFDSWTDELFDELVSRPFDNMQASGEDAEYWRRIFYDLRKMRALVFENDFAEAIVEAALRGVGLADFLHTGTLPDQRRWSGVLGQSASAPVFFLLREMHRLAIIPREVHPPTLFVCRPVRRAAADFGLITPELAARYDFASLLEASERICDALKGDPAGRELLNDYDVPLLHWAQNGMSASEILR